MKVLLLLVGFVLGSALSQNDTTTTPSPTTTTTTPKPKPCPVDWFDAGEYGCYYFTEPSMFPFGTNWFDAQAFCADRDAHLAEPDTIVSQALLANEAKRIEDTVDWWIGGLWNASGGRWYWLYSGNQIKQFDWGEDQPDEEEHDCIAMNHRLEFKWDDVSCMKLGIPICQLNP